MSDLTWEEFEKVGIIAGQIVRAEVFPEAKIPAYQLWVDLGELGVRASSARITDLYTVEELVGKLVICVTGFAPKRIGPFTSKVLVTGFYQEDGSVVLAIPERDVKPGTPLA